MSAPVSAPVSDPASDPASEPQSGPHSSLASAQPAARPHSTQPVPHLLSQACRRLERLLPKLADCEDHLQDLLGIAKTVVQAVETEPDIALACILLNQIPGSYALRHSVETATLVAHIARTLGRDGHETVTVTAAALTMNVGMLLYHDDFQSRHGSLTGEESAELRGHPQEGVAILRQAGVDDAEWLDCVLLHHERGDGSGYPFGRSADDIPQNAGLIGLADRYCAQVSARNYRKSILPDKALQVIFGANHQGIDPVLAECFIRELGSFPPGTYVLLDNGEIGVVTHRAAQGRAATVMALVAPNGVPLLPFPVPRTLVAGECAVRKALHEDEADIRFSMRQLWGEAANL